MVYTWMEAVKARILNDAVQVQLQDKPGSIHQGHQSLIEYGKTLGRVVVIIQEDYTNQSRFFFGGIIPTKDKLNISEEISSIEALGVDIIVRSKLKIEKDDRDLLFNEAVDFVRPYEPELIIQKKINQCRYLHMVRLFRIRTRQKLAKDHFKIQEINHSRIPQPRHILVGPDVDYFFAKAAYRSTEFDRYPDNLTLAPLLKDEYGLKVGSRNRLLQEDERAILPILRESVRPYLHEIQPGNNDKIIHQVNLGRKSDIWLMDYLVRYTGGIFGNSVLDYFGFIFKNSNTCIEDIDFTA